MSLGPPYPAGTASWPSTLLPGGTYEVVAHYEGDTTYGGSYSSPSAKVTVNPEASSVYMGTPPGVLINVGTYGNSVVYGTGAFDLYLLRADVYNSQGNPCNLAPFNNGPGSLPPGPPYSACPTGTISFTDTSSVPYSATLKLNSYGYTEDQAIQLAGGTHTLVANYSGDNSYKASTTTASVTVAQATSVISNVAISQNPANAGQQFTVTATVNTSLTTNTSYGLAPSGTVSFFYNTTQLLGTVQLTATNGNVNTGIPASLAASLTTSIPTAGNYNITATYSGDVNYTAVTAGQSNSVPITVNSTVTGSFTIAATNVTITAPGGPGQSQVTVTPSGGFTGSVSIVCTVPTSMTGATCSNTSANITGASAVTVPVTINTAAAGSSAIRAATTGMFGFGVLAGVFVFAIPGLRRRKAPLALLLFGIVVLIVSCGGGSSSSVPPPSTGTPPGTYTVGVTATFGSVSQSTSFSATVQ